MSSENTHIETAQGTGTSSSVGKTKLDLLRKRKAKEEGATKFIADSIYKVKFKPIYAADVLLRKGSLSDVFPARKSIDNLDKMLLDLSTALINLMTDAGIPITGLSIPTHKVDALFYMYERCKKVIPDGYDLTVDRLDEDYAFVLSKRCRGYSDAWYSFAAGPLLLQLKDEDIFYHDLFVRLLATLVKRFGIDAWWGDTMQHTFEHIRDHVSTEDVEEDDDGEDEDFDVSVYKREIAKYDEGQPALYAHSIQESQPFTHDELMTILPTLKKGHSLNTLFQELLQLLRYDCQWMDFSYNDGSKYDNVMLLLDYTINIVWEFHDFFTDGYCEYIDMEAAEGVEYPQISIPIKRSTHVIDWQHYQEIELFPATMARYFDNAHDIIQKHCIADELDN